MTETPCYLDGHYLPLSQATVSPLDRGFLLGDGVYEVIPVYGGRPFRLAAHLRRLADSLAAIRLAPPLTDTEWADIIETLLARVDDAGDRGFYLQVTRGAAARRDHRFPGTDTAATVFAYPMPVLPPANTTGATVVTAPDYRWGRCDIKSIALLANVLLRQASADQGADETLMLRDGLATEGSASNVFAVVDGVLATPPLGPLILPGITRALVLELARAEGVPCAERPLAEAELRGADEVWIASSTREVVAVVRIDGEPVGDGVPGPMWRRLRRAFDEHKAAFVADGARVGA